MSPEPPSSTSRSQQKDDSFRLEGHEEHTNVSTLHAVVLREHTEPKEGNEPMSLWLVVLLGMVLFWGGFYLQRYSGGYKALVYDERTAGAIKAGAVQPPAVDLFTQGKRLYASNCSPCHQPDGQGRPGEYPPLAGSEWVLAPGAGRIIRIVLDGLEGPITVKGVTFNKQMVPWRDILTDEQIASILTYIRGEKDWGNNASPVAPEQVKAVREQTKDHAGTYWTADALLAVPEVIP